MTPILFIHGAATTAAVWDRVIAELDDLRDTFELRVPERPRTGDLSAELAWLGDLAGGAWLVGCSGGATLALALASTDVEPAGGVLHEPAVGSAVPDLLAPMREAFEAGGTAAFGSRLYGPSWRLDDAGGHGDAVTARELAMFSGFEARPPALGHLRWVTTVGERSPAVRHRVADVLVKSYGFRRVVLEGASHFVQRDAAVHFAGVVRSTVLP